MDIQAVSEYKYIRRRSNSKNNYNFRSRNSKTTLKRSYVGKDISLLLQGNIIHKSDTIDTDYHQYRPKHYFVMHATDTPPIQKTQCKTIDITLPTQTKLKLQSLIESYAFTKPGLTKIKEIKDNQDAYYANDLFEKDISLYIICDGHGVYGKEISTIVKNTLPNKIKSNLKKFDIKHTLKMSIQQVIDELYTNEIIIEASGTTCIVALIQNQTLYSANIGDSRIVAAFYHYACIKFM